MTKKKKNERTNNDLQNATQNTYENRDRRGRDLMVVGIITT